MDMDREYANGAFIAGSAGLPDIWAQKAAAFRSGIGKRARLGIAYGPHDRQALDLFLPETTPRGLLVFIHGGYWMALGRESWSHLAAGALARGWACAMPSYTLAPQARIREMTAEIANAVAVAAAEVAGPLVITGHSAGGHLSARMGCTDHHNTRTARIVPISPLADLEPIMQTQMNEKLWLDADEVQAESPARHRLACNAHIWVGGNERPAFLWQARTLSENWDCDWTVEPKLHHFNVIDGLEQPNSALTKACLDGI
ncbi:MAG: alpha/beta hydrolase [Cypionkella sp.]